MIENLWFSEIFVDFGIVAKGLWNCIFFLSSNICYFYTFRKETCFPFFFCWWCMRLNLFSPGQLIEIRTPLHKASTPRQLSRPCDTTYMVLALCWESHSSHLQSPFECFVVINSKEKTVKMCSASCDTYPVSRTAWISRREQLVLWGLAPPFLLSANGSLNNKSFQKIHAYRKQNSYGTEV